LALASERGQAKPAENIGTSPTKTSVERTDPAGARRTVGCRGGQ